MKDIRWKQRFNNYLKAFQVLAEAITLSKIRSLSSLEQQGLILGFEFTHELAWNVLKDYLEHQGFTDQVGSRDATRLAFKNGLIVSGEDWMKMIEDRNLTSHAYNPDIALEVVGDIVNRFFPAFVLMAEKFNKLNLRDDTSP